VKDVPESCDVVASAEVDSGQIALGKGIACSKVESGDGLLRDVDDFWPVDSRDVDLLSALGKGDAPDTGAGGKIEYGGRPGGGKVEVKSQGLGRCVAHGENVGHELAEKLASLLLLVDGVYRLAAGYDLIQLSQLGSRCLLVWRMMPPIKLGLVETRKAELSGVRLLFRVDPC